MRRRTSCICFATYLPIVCGLWVNQAMGGSHGNGSGSFAPTTPSNAAPAVAQTLDSGALHIQADPVSTAAQDQTPQRIVISPDGKHIAFVSTRGSRFAVVVDGKPSGKYDEIGHINNAVNKEIIFSADGQHVMFVARRGEDQMVVVDGQEMIGYQLVEQFSFSPDGKQNTFVAQHDQQNSHQLAVVNGKDSPTAYVTITDMQFSSNSAHVAYIGTVADPSKPANTCVVMDGKNEPPFYHVHDLQFSADGNHWVYIGEDFTGNVQPGTTVQSSHLMVDGKELAKYEKVYNCQISADGHVAYCADKHTHTGAQSETVNDQCAGLDGQVWDLPAGHRLPWSQGGTAQPVYLSPDGQHVAWLEQAGNNDMCVTVNGKRGLGYKNILNIAFTKDSQHIYYVADQTSNGTYVVCDDDEAGPYKRAPNGGGMPFTLYFSPNGKHVAYQAGDGQMTFVVEDGKQQPNYEAIYGPLVFSPDGEHLAYVAKAKDPTANMTPIQRQQAMQSPNYDQGLYVVLDGQQQPVLSTVRFGSAVNSSSVHFSPDGKHIAYSDDGHQIVVDGHLIKFAPKLEQSVAGTSATLGFTPDNNHVIFLGGNHYFIDSDQISNFALPNTIPNYKPLLQPGGSVFFFAAKDGAGPALYRVTITPGSTHDFGTSGSTATIADSNPKPQQTTPPPSSPQQNPPPPQQQNHPSQSQDPTDAANNAVNQAHKAKDVGSALRGLFGH
jgi:WD40-like Beta Propeller Repeat